MLFVIIFLAASKLNTKDALQKHGIATWIIELIEQKISKIIRLPKINKLVQLLNIGLMLIFPYAVLLNPGQTIELPKINKMVQLLSIGLMPIFPYAVLLNPAQTDRSG